MEERRLAIDRRTALAVSLVMAILAAASAILAPRSSADARADATVAWPEAVTTVLADACGGRQRATGFSVGASFVTAAHTVVGAGEAVVGPGSRSTVLGLDRGLDVAVLTAGGTSGALDWADGIVEPDAAVTAVGWDPAAGLRVVEAAVQLLAPGDTWGFDGTMVVLDRPVPAGFSGGPVLDVDGDVVAVVVAVDRTTDLTLAVAATDVADWLADGSRSEAVVPVGC